MTLHEFIEATKARVLQTANEGTAEELTRLIWALQRMGRAAWHYRAAITNESEAHRATLRQLADQGLEEASRFLDMDTAKAPPVGLDYPFAETFERAMEAHQSVSRWGWLQDRLAQCRFCGASTHEGNARCSRCDRTLWRSRTFENDPQ